MSIKYYSYIKHILNLWQTKHEAAFPLQMLDQKFSFTFHFYGSFTFICVSALFVLDLAYKVENISNCVEIFWWNITFP